MSLITTRDIYKGCDTGESEIGESLAVESLR